MKKVLITGASGLLGRTLCAEFSKQNWNVLGLAFSRAKGDLLKVDLNDFLAVKNVIHQFKPEAIIHTAAERSPDKAENNYDACYALNVDCSKNLAAVAKEVNAAFLYISTDYVFDGENPPYKELDVPNPINKYGLSKWEGEKAVMDTNSDSCVLRVPVLYGEEEYIGESAISSLIKNLLAIDQEAIKVSNFEARFPSCTSDIAAICHQLIEEKLKTTSLNSVFHWCGKEQLTKYEMTLRIAEVSDLPHSHIFPDDSPPCNPLCPRPKNTQLSCERLERLGIGKHTPFMEGSKCFLKLLAK